MAAPTRILLQTTTIATGNDWTIDRFSLLRRVLEERTSKDGMPLTDARMQTFFDQGSRAAGHQKSRDSHAIARDKNKEVAAH